MTSPQERLVLDMFAAVNADGPLAAASFYAAHTRVSGHEVGRAGVERVFADISMTFPDAHFRVEQVLTQGEWVVVRGTFSGTHLGTGRLLGLHDGLLAGLPPTGRTTAVRHLHLYEVRGGLITDHHGLSDNVGMARQLGLPVRVATGGWPPPGGPVGNVPAPRLAFPRTPAPAADEEQP